MRLKHRTLISVSAYSAIVGLSADQVLAVCAGSFNTSGSGLPSISATESSTTQALELVERRRRETTEGALLTTSAEPAAAEAPAEPAPKPASPDTKPGAAKAAAASVKPKKTVKKPEAPTQTAMLEQDSAPAGYQTSQHTTGTGKTRGTWVSGYFDYDRNSDVNIGVRTTQPTANLNKTPSEADTNVTRRTRSGGVLAGMDWTNLKAGTLRGQQFGMFGGYNKSSSDYTDGTFSIFEIDPGSASGTGQEEQFRRTNAREETQSGTVGGYGIFFNDRWTTDVTLKADIGSMDADQTLQKLNCFTTQTVFGKVDFTDYTVAANLSYRFDIHDRAWWEPLIGVRYTFTDYGSSTGKIALGQSDGHLLRVQAGARVSNAWMGPAGTVWVTSVTGALYSDVLLEGYFGKTGIDLNNDGFIDQFVDSASLNDEGKVRVLGQISTVVMLRDGVSLLAEVETRGGDQYMAVGGRLGGRVEW
jgi:hypothetical protein